MAFQQKTFRKCGSHYSDISALHGVEVRVGPSFQPPAKVALPVGFHQKDPSEILSLTYEFELENEVIAKAEALTAQKQQKKEENDAKTHEQDPESGPPESNDAMAQIQNRAFSTDILQPTTVSGLGHVRNNSLGGKNSFDLADFENNTSNPFELVELQTINDLDELKDVLRQSVAPTTTSGMQTSCEETTGTIKTRSNTVSSSESGFIPQANRAQDVQHPHQTQQPFSYLSNGDPLGNISQQNSTNLTTTLSKSVPDISNIQLVNLSDSGTSYGGTHMGVSTTTTAGYNALPQSFNQPTVRHDPQPYTPMLIDIGSHEVTPPELPKKHYNINTKTTAGSSSASNTGTFSATGTGVPLRTSPLLSTRSNHLPPLQNPPPIPPRRPTADENRPVPAPRKISTPGRPGNVPGIIGQGGTVMSDGMLSSSPRKGPVPVPKSRCATTPVPLPRTTPVQVKTKRHSSPLPPISSPTLPPSYQSTLPDPMPLLTDKEKMLVNYISIMGFPVPRVARAVQRLGDNDREVIDYLVAVDELSQAGHQGDDAEIAMGLNDFEKPKALEFLELSKKFMELGFKEAHIQEALKAAGNDRDKALDFLTSISI